jgi:hypothetical protein
MIEREKRWRISILRWYWPSHISSIEHLSWLNDKKRWRKRNLISLEFRFVLFVHPSSIFISYLRLKATEWNIHRVRMYICAFICTPKCECVCFFFSFFRLEEKKKKKERKKRNVHECVIVFIIIQSVISLFFSFFYSRRIHRREYWRYGCYILIYICIYIYLCNYNIFFFLLKKEKKTTSRNTFSNWNNLIIPDIYSSSLIYIHIHKLWQQVTILHEQQFYSIRYMSMITNMNMIWIMKWIIIVMFDQW